MNRRSFLLKALFPVPLKYQYPFPAPRYKIGDRIRYQWHEQATGRSGWEVGIVQGLMQDKRGNKAKAEWLYEIYIIESTHQPSVGKIDEVYESETEPVSLPIWEGWLKG